jgi:hypothetical protein
MNELLNETSPYLLQHANNPVHWKAWNSKTLAEAASENKLIIISVGYSACHWCHVMEHESFEDNEVAEVMNRDFISIKVDREERPDVDAVYMKAVQLMGGHGGWPLNVVALPDGRPVWGGTYFPKKTWIDYLQQLSMMYRDDQEKLLDYAERLHYGIQSISVIQRKESDKVLSQDLLKPIMSKWKRNFDHEFGGMARAPKFMMPNNYRFMMRYAHQNNDKKLMDFVNLTLTKMAYGGLFDTLGGGFSRYSVDMKWHVPHFEKMLYDNGQLVSLYADAYKLTKNPLYKEVIEKTHEFISSELSNGEGGFYSALDADSLDAENHLEEGAFYVWSKEELQKIIQDDFELFSEVFNINEFGYWENGNYVLIQKDSLEQIAAENNTSVAVLKSKKSSWEKFLFEKRQVRNKPRLDDKCLTSWNALMCKGYVDAYKALENEEYLYAAVANANFILQKCLDASGKLNHSFKDGRSTINGYLEDYALVTNSFIAIYEATFDEKWLREAHQLTDYCFDNFFDDESGFFAFTSITDQPLITRHFETEDNVIPASNSVMAENLYKLAIYFGNTRYEEVATSMLQHIIPDVDYPSAFTNWLYTFMNYSDANKELAICGSNALTYAKRINSMYLPQIILAGTDKQSSLPFLSDRFVEGKTLFYVCKNKTCDLPSDNFDDVLKTINQ